MRCPFCKQDHDRVIDSRAASEGYAIRRRRECLACSRRFTTYERMEQTPLRVVKKDGSRVPFDRGRILSGLMKACEKRPVAMEQLDEITARIEEALNERFDKEVDASYIGDLVMEELRSLDKVAYVRFASVYREFKDANEFMEELRSMFGNDG